MTKLEKTVLTLQSILVVLFIGLFLAITFGYVTFNQIRYLFYAILILSPAIGIWFLRANRKK
ncbi:MAG: hypothetical protein ACTHVE_06785 [Senegalia sp. (in: firmicutes)]|uniref:hypothetical protein n=1 Tax=Bacillota TaxID=1239 RepID=UPI003F95335D